MIKRQYGKILRPFVLLIMLLSVGCAQQMKSVQPDTAPEALANAELKSIKVSDDASRIEILSNKPIVYTYYMLETPPRLVVDLAQTTSGTLVLPIEVNKGNVNRIDVAKHEFGSGVLSRVEVLLTSKADAVAALDQQDKNRLIINISAPPPPEPAPAATAAADLAATPAAAPVVAAAPAAPAVETVQIVEPTPVSGENKGTAAAEKQAAPAVNQEPAEKTAAGSGEKAGKQEAAAAEPAAVPVKAESVTPEPVAESTAKAATPPVAVAAPAKTALKPGERGLVAITKTDEAIQLEISGAIDSYKVFRLNQPERLVIDVAKTKSLLATKTVDINAFNLGKARIGGSPDKLRIVFDGVGSTVPHYTVTKNSAGLLIAFGDAPKKGDTIAEARPVESAPKAETSSAVAEAKVAVAAAAPTPAPAATADPVKAAAKKPLAGFVEAVEFSQTDGISRIKVKTSGDCVVRQPVKTAKGYSLTLKDCRLPANQQRQLDTKGFASAIKSIAPFSVKGKKPETRIAVNLRGALPNSLKQEGDTLYWEFKEPAGLAQPVKTVRAPKAAATAAMTPPPLLDKEIPEAKHELAESKADKGLEESFAMTKVAQPVVRPGKVYTGRKVTLEFSDADIKKIFQLLAEVSNQNFLISDDVGGTISLKLVNVPWDQALDVILENKSLGMQRDGNIVQIRPKTKMKSLDEEAIELRITEEKKMPLSTVIFDVNFATIDDIKNQFKNLASKRPDASISGDSRTNKIIVVDIDPNIKKMRALLEALDVPEKQVMIEARIVEAESNFTRDIGVKWDFGYTDGSASVANINNITGSMGGVVTTGLSGTAGGITTGISFGKLISNIQLDLRLSAAASINQVKIISTPKVMTVNNKAAKISQGQMIPYQNTTSTDGAKTEFIEAALSLEVTPHITADGSVNMKIRASNNSPGTGSPPSISKKEATTELVVKNGETTVIGGIYVDRDTDAETGVPYLSEIPLLGWLFKSNSKNKTKNELLIFITPKIMN